MKEKKKPLISVISGYYNREHLVDESVQSLIDQSYTNLEIIIFDDCSTDNTYEKLKKFESDQRVKIIKHETNIGFVSGLINAIETSKGDYIAIHGSGDYSYPTRFEKQINVLLQNEPISVVSCENETFSDGGRIIGRTNRYPAGNFYKDLQKDRIKISGGDVMFKRNYYEKVGGYREFFRFAQDFDLWCRMSLISEYYIIPEVLYRRGRFLEGSVSGTVVKRVKQIFYGAMALECVKKRKQVGQDYIDILGEESFIALEPSKRISRKLSILAIKLYLEGRKSEADFILSLAKKQKTTLSSIILIILNYNILPDNLLSFLIKKSFIKKLFIKK